MRIFLLTLALATAVCATAQTAAPNGPSAEERAQQRTTEMVSQLGLSAQQQEQVGAINLTFVQQLDEVHQSVAAQDRAARGKALKDERDRLLKNVLSEVQYDRMIELRQAGRSGAPARPE